MSANVRPLHDPLVVARVVAPDDLTNRWVSHEVGGGVLVPLPLQRTANDPKFIEIIERSRARYKATGGISLAEMRQKYSVPAKSKRRATPRKPR